MNKIIYLLIFLILMSCSISAQIKNNKSDHTNDLINYFFSYSLFYNKDLKTFNEVLENNKSVFSKEDYLYLKVLANTILGKESPVDMLIESDKLGNIEAGEYIYEFYFEDDFEMRLKYLESAAEKGNYSAQYTLGHLYFHGRNYFKSDKNKGIKYLELSAMQGVAMAIRTLGQSKYKKSIPESKHFFWRTIYLIYDKNSTFDVNERFKKVKDKQQFCKQFKDFVYENEVKEDKYREEKFTASFEILAKCFNTVDKKQNI